MPRFTIDGNPISVDYGYDEPMDSVFFAAIDNRLEYNSEDTDEVNSITHTVGCQDGGGSYLNLYTGKFGIGTRVSDATMKTYLFRYGLTKKNVEDVFKYQEVFRHKNAKTNGSYNNNNNSNNSINKMCQLSYNSLL
jgi:hypothetical protein